MASSVEYLDQVAYDSLYDQPLNALDLLILTEITYLPFEGLVSSDLTSDCDCRLMDVAPKMSQDLSMMVTKNRLKLLEKAAASTRFKNFKLMGFVNDIDTDIQKQFSALIFKAQPDSYILVFRGTDDSIIGWKEDFHMTYMDQVPAQKTAAAYLKKALAALPGSFILSGHSKGGNLAAYAASQLEPEDQERIQAIYSYDAPGLNRSVIDSPSYQALVDKIHRFIPQGSIVGMMLETASEAQIIKSSAIGGFAQHNTFSWQVRDQDFVLLDSLSSDSLQTDKTLKNWVDSVADSDLKDFFDLFFGLVLDAGIQSIDELTKLENIKKIGSVLKNAQNLSDQERDMLLRLGSLLIDMRIQSWKDDISLPNPAELGKDIRNNLSQFISQLPFVPSKDKDQPADSDQNTASAKTETSD